MDANTLAVAMGNSIPLAEYERYAVPMNEAMIAAQCTTVDRAAIWLSQMGHESGGLRWLEEIADGSAYEGRVDLGNTEPGWGRRYKGRGIVQLTGAHNYRKFSEWAHATGRAGSPTYFFDNPHMVAEPKWSFLAATWYWTVARPQINSLCDKRDFAGVTRAINGGTNGLADRTLRWNNCLALGEAILPTASGGAVSAEDQVKTELVGPGFDGWEILGRSKVDPRRHNTMVEAIAEIRDQLVKPRDSFVEGSTVKFDLGTFVQCTDASTYRSEREVMALRAQVAELTKAVQAIAAKVGA